MNWINNIGLPNILIFIGILFTAIGGIWSAYESNKKNFELQQSSEKVEILSKKINDNLTSAESFVYLIIENFSFDPPQVGFLLVQQGVNPIYDLKIRAVLLEEHQKLRTEKGKETIEDSTKIDKFLEIGNVGINKVFTLPKWEFPEYEEYHFDIYLDHMHGSLLQIFRISKREGNYQFETVVKDLENNHKIIFQLSNIKS